MVQDILKVDYYQTVGADSIIGFSYGEFNGSYYYISNNQESWIMQKLFL